MLGLGFFFVHEPTAGPVRTALKRGWKVELYSWQGGLSELLFRVSRARLMTSSLSLLGRAWKREFGHDSEWGKKGMFRVIGMEQFASSLVEDGWVEV